MVDKFLSPVVFPLILLGLCWLSERNKSPDHTPNRDRMRFWIACWTLLAVGDYAIAWHNEIGHAWQSYPTVTFFSTLVIFVVIGWLPPSKDSLKNLF